MKREKLLPQRMNALWFTYVSIFLFAMLPDFGVRLSFLQVVTGGVAWVVLVNLWALYNNKPIMDERKQRVATDAMAWAFVVVSFLLIPAATTGVELDASLIRSTAGMGLWTWLIVFSVKNLYQRYGSDIV